MQIIEHADTLYINGVLASREDRAALASDIRGKRARIVRQLPGLYGRKLVVHAEVER